MDSVVTQVQATDADSGNNMKLSYFLQSENGAHQFFKINRETGLVQVSLSRIPTQALVLL